MNITPTAADRNYCLAYEDGYIYEMCYGVDWEWKTISFEFL